MEVFEDASSPEPEEHKLVELKKFMFKIKISLNT